MGSENTNMEKGVNKDSTMGLIYEELKNEFSEYTK